MVGKAYKHSIDQKIAEKYWELLFQFRKKKYVTLKFFEFQELFMIVFFLKVISI